MRYYLLEDDRYQAVLKKRPKRRQYGNRRHFYFAMLRWRFRMFVAFMGSDRGL